MKGQNFMIPRQYLEDISSGPTASLPWEITHGGAKRRPYGLAGMHLRLGQGEIYGWSCTTMHAFAFGFAALSVPLS